MALLVVVILALCCLGGLTAPTPTPMSVAIRELIKELGNITQDQKTPLCNGSMVWSANLTAGGYCEARAALTNTTSCSAVLKIQKMLNGLCAHSASTGRVPSLRDTKIEVARFMENLLRYSQQLYRSGRFQP
ncbi:interleukin-13 [Perognathus longimembris pacificus]|uniref:interleukin-13 n=1 Tax=Perognathus longimembris pacificus TaxID=214514 RepID=UPI002018A725|nr:interleukin-13 [Perognathus longimembris pacificus]